MKIIVILILRGQDWHMDSVDMYDKDEIESLKSISSCYESTTLFWVTNIQYIAVVISFSIGSAFKKPFYTNMWFTFFFIAILLFSTFTIFSTSGDFMEFFDLKVQVERKNKIISSMPYSWRVFVAIFCVVNMALTLAYEKYALPFIVNSIKNNLKKEKNKKKDSSEKQNNNIQQINNNNNNNYNNINNDNNNNNNNIINNDYIENNNVYIFNSQQINNKQGEKEIQL